MELNKTDEFTEALEWMNHPERSLFLTGKAGTGKSTLLEYFRDQTDGNIAVLAPTGVAAVNVRGQTIHSFFGFGPDVTVRQIREGTVSPRDDELYEELDTLVIDEISMVRADLMDCMDTFLRRYGPSGSEPFGSVKTILIGDPFQLEPVHKREETEFIEQEYDSPWFFDSHVFNEMDCKMVELTTVHRQTDPDFVELLNAIRTRTVTDEQLARLNECVDEDFQPDRGDFYVYLTPTNKPAREINRDRLETLDGTPETFEAEVTGEFEESRAPTDRELELKPDAQVMMLNNDARARWVNGTMGRVREIKPDGDDAHVTVKLETGEVVKVTPYEWEMIEFNYDRNQGQLVPTTLGTFEQIPMSLSWAVTIHKSQGKTLDRVILDTTKASMFAHGQAYVALSRCTSLGGLILKQPLRKKDVWMDWRVVEFFKEYHLEQEDEMDREGTIDRLERAIDSEADVEILYVNSKGEKSRRTVRPREVGTFSYRGNSYEGLDAYSYKHGEPRQFSLKRIARVHSVPEDEPSEK